MLKIISSRMATIEERRARRDNRQRLNAMAETFPEEEALVAAFDADTLLREAAAFRERFAAILDADPDFVSIADRRAREDDEPDTNDDGA